MSESIQPYNIWIAGGNKRTSIRLEPVIRTALEQIAEARGKSVDQLIDADLTIDLGRGLASSIRSYIVTYLLDRAGYEKVHMENVGLRSSGLFNIADNARQPIIVLRAFTTPIKPHVIWINEPRRRTSVRLEPIFWNALGYIADDRGKLIDHLIDEDIEIDPGRGLASSIRCFVIAYLLDQPASE